MASALPTLVPASATSCVHYLTPLLVVAQWLLLADKSSLGWRSALWVVDAAAGLLRLCHAPGPQRQTHRPHPSGVSLPVSGPAPARLAEIHRIRDGDAAELLSAGLWHDVAGSAGRNASGMKKRTGQVFSLVPVLSMSLLPLLGKSSFLGRGTSSPSGREPIRHCGGTHQAAYRLYAPDVLRDASPGGDFPLRRAVRGAAFPPAGCCSGCLPKYFSPFWGRMRHSGV